MTTRTSRTPLYLYRKYRTKSGIEDWGGYSHFGVLNTSSVNTVTLGDSLPPWRERIRENRSATSVLSGVKHTCTLSNDGYGYVFLQHKTVPSTKLYTEVLGCLPDPHLINPSDPSAFIMQSVKNRVIQSVNNQIRSANKSLQGLVSAGEFGETVRMLNHTGRDLFRRTDTYLKDLAGLARHVTPQNLTRMISRRWLEYNLGVKPLISDIDGYMSAIDRYRSARPPTIHIRASSESEEKNLPLTSATSPGNIWVVSTGEKSSVYGFKIYGKVGLSDYHSAPLRHEFGITFDEFFPTVWELIPYSFLIDYVTNIGAVIDAYSLNKSSVRWLAYGERRISRCKTTVHMFPQASDSYTVKDRIFRYGTPLTREWIKVNRGEYFVSGLIPDLEFKLPGSSTKWLNISALAASHSDASLRLRTRR